MRWLSIKFLYPGLGYGQFLSKATSLLICVTSALYNQSWISSPGRVTPFCSIVNAVARTSAVTPVNTTVVNFEASRFDSGNANDLGSDKPKFIFSGYNSASKSLWMGDRPSTLNTFHFGLISSNGRIAQLDILSQAASIKISDDTLRTAPGAGSPKRAVK